MFFWSVFIGLILLVLAIAGTYGWLPEDQLPEAHHEAYGIQFIFLVLVAMSLITLIAEFMREKDLEALQQQTIRLQKSERDRLNLEIETRMQELELLATVGRLAAATAHEVNNPLTYVIGNIELILRQFEHATDDWQDATQAAQEVLQGARHIQHVVKDLNQFSKSDPSKGAVQVEQVVIETLKIAQNELRHRAHVKTHFAPVPDVYVSPTHLGQIILNLLINAAQAIPVGAKATNSVTIHVGMNAAGAVTLEVRDTGTGITNEDMPNVFDPFFSHQEGLGRNRTRPIGV